MWTWIITKTTFAVLNMKSRFNLFLKSWNWMKCHVQWQIRLDKQLLESRYLFNLSYQHQHHSFSRFVVNWYACWGLPLHVLLCMILLCKTNIHYFLIHFSRFLKRFSHYSLDHFCWKLLFYKAEKMFIKANGNSMTINLLDAILWELTERVTTFYHSRKNHI